MSAGTPFHPRTSALNRKLAWGEWSGYHSAAVYADDHDIEYAAIRNGAAMIDVSPLYKYIVSGPDACRLIDRVITRDASRLDVGQVLYTPWCDERGKVIDDGTVARLGEHAYRWTAALPSYRWIGMNASGLDVEVVDVTDTTAALALQGPTSRALLAHVCGEALDDLRYFRRRTVEIAGATVDVSRTGYTGDLGFELWMENAAAAPVWDALMAAGPAYAMRPSGIRAMDVARVEAGLLLIEVDYTSVEQATTAAHEYSPFELGLGGLVDFRKPRFVGRRALATEQEQGGPPRRFVGLALDWGDIERAFARVDLPPAIAATVLREQIPLRAGSSQMGRATSTTWSPTLKSVLALGSVRAAHANPGTTVVYEMLVDGERADVAATVVQLPFLDLPRKRG